jgi:hypothetical protein
MSTQWITDRLPTKQDAFAGQVICMLFPNQICDHMWLQDYTKVKPGEPWQPITKPAPYVKPKRWKVKWNESLHCWDLMMDKGLCYGQLFLKKEHTDIAQRIEDLFNEVMP